MSDTPRTDAVTEHYFTGGLRSASVVRTKFARELERELAQHTAERDEAWLTNATLRAELARANAERDEARRIACDADAAYRMNGWSEQQYHPSLARQIATERGWNCFAEESKR
jgi:hypothetical protein